LQVPVYTLILGSDYSCKISLYDFRAIYSQEVAQLVVGKCDGNGNFKTVLTNVTNTTNLAI